MVQIRVNTQYKRDELLADLRGNVINVSFPSLKGQERVLRCTLKDEFLPPAYVANPHEVEREAAFHRNNPDMIVAWNVQGGGWVPFNIADVIWAQSHDTY